MRSGPQPLVGREAELATLRDVVARACGGRSAVIVVQAPPGQGKSALLAALAAGAGDALVLSVTGTQSETTLPFAGLDALLRPLLDHLPALPAPQAEALERALALRPGGPVDPFAVAAAT